MNKILLSEAFKLALYSIGIYIFISLCEKRNEFVANQFVLDSQHKIYHSKNYSNQKSDSCPLYSTNLSNFD